MINKVDKENCTPDEVHEKVFDLMFELGAEEWQLDFPTVYGSAKNNWMNHDWKDEIDNIEPLLDMVIEHIPSPKIPEGNTTDVNYIFRFFILYRSYRHWSFDSVEN